MLRSLQVAKVEICKFFKQAKWNEKYIQVFVLIMKKDRTSYFHMIEKKPHFAVLFNLTLCSPSILTLLLMTTIRPTK